MDAGDCGTVECGMMGYNVNAQAKLTEVQRRKILELIVDERILR